MANEPEKHRIPLDESQFPKTWECKECGTQYTDREKGFGIKCWQGHWLTRIEDHADAHPEPSP